MSGLPDRARGRPKLRMGSQAGDLKDLVIAAHGGLDRWNRPSEVRAHRLLGGVPWPLRKQDGALNLPCRKLQAHMTETKRESYE